MSHVKASTMRDMSVDEITTRIGELREELFNLRFRNSMKQLDNPLRIEQLRHGLAAALNDWVRDGVAPPDSCYPRVLFRQLVPVSELSTKIVHGVEFPHFNYEVYRTDFGSDWARGIVAEPPRVDGVYPTLVPQVNADGLEIAGVHQLPTAFCTTDAS